jgi:hypothetical protein
MAEPEMSTKEHPESERLGRHTEDRRRHPRYRFNVPIAIRIADGSAKTGMTLEISASGISVMTADSLRVGDTVELEPVAGSKALALVRHKAGTLYGFEFLNLTTEQGESIAEACKTLPLYRNSLNI